MKALVFYFEPSTLDVWSGRDIDLDCWKYTAQSFGFDTLVMIDLVPGGTLVPYHYSSPVLLKYPSMQSFLDAHSALTKVWAECKWTLDAAGVDSTNSRQFNHVLDDCAYILGSSAGSGPVAGDGKQWIYVNQIGTAALHPIHIATVIAEHRASFLGLV